MYFSTILVSSGTQNFSLSHVRVIVEIIKMCFSLSPPRIKQERLAFQHPSITTLTPGYLGIIISGQLRPSPNTYVVHYKKLDYQWWHRPLKMCKTRYVWSPKFVGLRWHQPVRPRELPSETLWAQVCVQLLRFAQEKSFLLLLIFFPH